MSQTTEIEFDPLAPAQQRDPYPLYARLRAEAPVFHAPAFDFWVVSRYDDVLAVLKDDETFSSVDALRSREEDLPSEVDAALAEGFAGMPVLVDSDPPLHTRIRGLVTRAFTPRRVAEMAPRIETATTALIDRFATDGSAEIVESFAWPLPLAVIGDMLGVPRDDLPRLHEWGNDWLRLYQPNPLEHQLELARSVVALQRYFAQALAEREHAPRDDLLTALLEASRSVEPPLELGAVVGVPFDLVVAGHVTVTRAIGSALLLLLTRPERLEALRADPALWPAAIEEIVRLESPAQGLFRRTTRAVELGGATIPAGARVMVHYGSANRDETQFREPDAYLPGRPDGNRHVAFGKGIHFCIGAPLARLELRIALPLLLERLPNVRLRPGVEPEFERIFFARGLARLELEWDPA
jgi:cytochrome P450